MLTWADAHRIAMTSTLRLFRDLSIDVTARISPLEVATKLGLTVRMGPLPRLAGAYIREPDVDPGVLVNNRHPPSKQRYTTGHEIGHHVHGHESSFDALTEIAQTAGEDSAGISDQERVAEAFSAWLLMPRVLVQNLLAQMNVPRDPGPAEIYQLSLRLGTSYQATNLQLANLRAQTHAQAAERSTAVPQKLKQAILGDSSPGVGTADVHHVTSRECHQTISVAPNDIIVIDYQHSPDGEFRITGGPLEMIDETRDTVNGTSRARLRVGTLPLVNPATPPRTAHLHSGQQSAVSLDVRIEYPFEGISESSFH